MRAGSLRAAALYTALTVLLTYPLAFRLHLMDAGDSAFFAWAIGWERHALFNAPALLPHGNMFFPLRYTLGMDEPVLGTSVLVLPLALVTDDAVLLYNVARLLTFVLSALSAYLLARTLGASEARPCSPALPSPFRRCASTRSRTSAPWARNGSRSSSSSPSGSSATAARATRWPRGRCSRSRHTPAGTTGSSACSCCRSASCPSSGAAGRGCPSPWRGRAWPPPPSFLFIYCIARRWSLSGIRCGDPRRRRSSRPRSNRSWPPAPGTTSGAK